MLVSSWFKLCAFFQSSGRLLPCCWSASSYHRLVSKAQVGLFTPSKVSSPTLVLCRWSWTYSSPSTSPSPSAPNSFGESFASFIYVMIWFWLSALQIPWRITWNTSIFYFSWFSSWCEDRSTLGKDLALASLGRRQWLTGLMWKLYMYCDMVRTPWE